MLNCDSQVDYWSSMRTGNLVSTIWYFLALQNNQLHLPVMYIINYLLPLQKQNYRWRQRGPWDHHVHLLAKWKICWWRHGENDGMKTTGAWQLKRIVNSGDGDPKELPGINLIYRLGLNWRIGCFTSQSTIFRFICSNNLQINLKFPTDLHYFYSPSTR